MFTFRERVDQLKWPSMSVLLSTSGGIYHWNIRERVPVKKYASTDRGIVSATASPDGAFVYKWY